MAVSIGSLQYDIIADTTKFKKGVTATRRELSSAKKVMLDTLTPAEKLAVELKGLEKLYEKGAIDLETYRRAQQRLKQQMKEAELQAKKNKRSFMNMATAMKGLLIGGSVAMVFRSLRKEMQVIDEIAKTSKKLGVTTTELQAMRMAGGELAGMMDSSVDMAMQRFTRRVSEAAQGTGEAQNVIKELNLDARQMNLAGPVKAFGMVAKAMEGVSSQQDKLRIAFKLFDSEGAAMVNVLNAGERVAGEYANEVERLGLAFDDIEASKIEKANDELARMGKELQALKREAVITSGPTVVTALRSAKDALGYYGQLQERVKESALLTSKALIREQDRNKVLSERLALVAAANAQEADLEGRAVFERNRERIAQEREQARQKAQQSFESMFGDVFEDTRSSWQQVVDGAKEAGMQITDVLQDSVTKGMEAVDRNRLAKELASPGPFGDPFAPSPAWFGLADQFANMANRLSKITLPTGPEEVKVTNFPAAATRDSREEYELRKQIAQNQGTMQARQHHEAQQKRQTIADLLTKSIQAISPAQAPVQAPAPAQAQQVQAPEEPLFETYDTPLMRKYEAQAKVIKAYNEKKAAQRERAREFAEKNKIVPAWQQRERANQERFERRSLQKESLARRKRGEPQEAFTTQNRPPTQNREPDKSWFTLRDELAEITDIRIASEADQLKQAKEQLPAPEENLFDTLDDNIVAQVDTDLANEIDKQTTTTERQHAQAQAKRDDQKTVLEAMLEQLQRFSFEAV